MPAQSRKKKTVQDTQQVRVSREKAQSVFSPIRLLLRLIVGILILLLIWFLFLIRNILLMLFLAIVIVSAIQPIIDRLEKRRIPRVISTIFIYLLFLLTVGSMIYLIVPVLTEELNQFAQDIPKYLQGLTNFFENIVQIAADYNFEEDLRRLISNATNCSGFE